MNKEQLRMQMLAGILTEGQYKAMLNENMEDPNYIAQYIAGGFDTYIIPGSPKFTYGPDDDGTYHLEFQLGFDDLDYDTPEEEEEELERQIGGYYSGGPGQAFSRTRVSYEGENNGKYIFSVYKRGGYDV